MSRYERPLPGTNRETPHDIIARRRRENAADGREITHRAAVRSGQVTGRGCYLQATHFDGCEAEHIDCAAAALLAEVERLRVRLDACQLRYIEATNPGIDMDDIKRIRAGGRG